MTDRHIVAASGGFVSGGRGPFDWRLGPLMRYALSLTGRERPRLCWLGTAHGDADSRIAGFYAACSGEAVRPSHLQLFSMPNHDDPAAHLLEQDVIWVGGGSVANLLAVWRTHGLDTVFREAWERGVVLGGVSAGSICWHVGGTTDSFGLELRPVTDGLGLLPYSNGVHYDSEERRRPLFQRLIAEGTLPDGFATDDGVALHFTSTELHAVISDTPGKAAWRVARDARGEVDETRLDPVLLR